MKKVWILMSLVLIFAGMNLMSIFAVNSTSKWQVACIDKGEYQECIISIRDNPGIAGMAFNLSYDNKKIELVSAQLCGEVFETAIIDKDGGYIYISYVEASNENKNGSFITIQYKWKEVQEENTYPFIINDFDACNEELEDVYAQVEYVTNTQNVAETTTTLPIISEKEEKGHSSKMDKENNTFPVIGAAVVIAALIIIILIVKSLTRR